MVSIPANTYNIFSAVYSSAPGKSSQAKENELLINLIGATKALMDILVPKYPKLPTTLPVNRLEKFALLLQETDDPLAHLGELKEFLAALGTYRDNLSGFIEGEVSGESTYAKLISARKESVVHNGDPKYIMRAVYFEDRLAKERLKKGASTEVGAYAKVLDLREEINLKKILYKDSGSEGLTRARQIYNGAFEGYRNLVLKWKSSQEGSAVDIYKNAVEELYRNEDAFLFNCRKEILLPHAICVMNAINDLSGKIETLTERIHHLEKKPSSLIEVIKRFFGFTPKKSDLITEREMLKEVRSSLESPVRQRVDESIVTPQDEFASFLDQMPLFNENVRKFMLEKFKLPELAQVLLDGNQVTIILPDTPPSGKINGESILNKEKFLSLNRQENTENLKLLKGKSIPRKTSSDKDEYTVKDLDYFRSIGPRTTKEIKKGVTLSANKRIVLEVNGNTLKFKEGAPKLISSGGSTIDVLGMTLHDLSDEAAEKEVAKVSIETRVPIGIFTKTFSDEFFLSDVGDLLSLMA
ncbi:MAG: hypothetical protein HRU43_05130 [Simkaniaceae bacterium]|nr:hypothetical protein [Simkaniaceae bacterium]